MTNIATVGAYLGDPKMRSKVLTKWHDWFAWHPVKACETDDFDYRWVWLETVRRKAENAWGFYDYDYELIDEK